jgi:hypothetical protein
MLHFIRRHLKLDEGPTGNALSAPRQKRTFDSANELSAVLYDPQLKARAHVSAAICSDLSVDAGLVTATHRAILKSFGAAWT